jgi:hypothetical protein
MYAREIKQTEATVPGITRVVSKNEADTIVSHAEDILLVA